MINPISCRSPKKIFTLDFWGAILVILAFLGGCSTPGAVAPATLPIQGEYVEVGPVDERTSCGYAFLMIPFGNPDPVSDIIDAMVEARGGDALVKVSSESSSSFYILGSSNCFTVRGTVVRFQ